MPGTPTTKHALPTLAAGGTDAINGFPAVYNALAAALDSKIATFSAANPRPAAGVSGRLHRHPTTGAWSFDTGTAWEDVSAGNDGRFAPIGALQPYAGASDPTTGLFGTWLLADGRLLDRSTAEGGAFYAIAGHAYNNGVDPGSNKVRIPDKRGRASVGADSMGTLQGAAGRLPNSNRARGQTGGEERHALSAGEHAVHSHDGTTGAENSSLSHTHGGTTGGENTGHVHGLDHGSVYTADNPTGSHTPVGLQGGSTTTLFRGPVVTGGESTGHVHGFGTAAGGPGAHSHSFTTANQGSGSPHNNMQPYEVDNWIVRVR